MRPLLLLLLLFASAPLAAQAPVAPTPAGASPGEAAPVADVPGAAPTSAAAAPPSAGAAPPAPAWAPALRREAQAVLSGPDFKGEETSRGLVARDWLRQWLKPEAEKPAKQPDLDWLPAVAELVKWLLVAALVAALAWLLWRGWQWLAPQVRGRRPPAGAPALREATSIALADTPLPDTVSRAARAAWQAGNAEEALSLLYRGALRALDQHYRIELPASATEGECLRRARTTGKAVVGSGFAPVVQAWMALAYARRQPADFEQLLGLYTRHFEPRGNGEGAA